MARNREEDIHLEAYFKWLQDMKWDSNAFHVPNENMIGGAYGATRKRKGVKSGVSDVLIDEAHQGKHGLRIELKAHNGTISFDQLVFLHNENNNGYLAVVAFGLQAAVNITVWYMNNGGLMPVKRKKCKRNGIPFEYLQVLG